MGKTEVEVITINKLPEKITIVINWSERKITVFRHSMSAYKAVIHDTINGKPVSYDKMRRRLKRGESMILDSGNEVLESGLIN